MAGTKAAAPTASTLEGESRYTAVAKTLHWLIAAAILLNITLGLYMGDLPRSDPMQFQFIQLHKSIGLTVLVLSVLRVVWRLIHPVPPLPADMAPQLKMVARGMHVLLYVLILALPLTGWMMVSSSPLALPTSYFGLFNWPHIWFLADLTRATKRGVVDLFGETHEMLAWIMIALVALHVLGAFYHQVFRSDGVLTRILPGG